MTWPLPQDFNEAVQNPATAFSDSDLKDGQAVVGPTGLPLPRSGNFADVYQIRAANNKDWAVKCFTRPVTGLGERYKKVDDALKKAGLPFAIGFAFLNEGVMVHGAWRPAVKMEWVDGLQLNQVVRVQAGSPKVLDALGLMWSRLCKKLRESGIAHADLQHGNVLLVAGSKPGSYGLKLIDYDGMYVPSLANTPSGESGHPNYQHPQRAGKQVYSPDLDRFPHLVIATALKGLAVLGPKLWEKYDTGDNLLFTEEDFKSPAWSALMKELWDAKDPGLQALVGHLAIACGKPIPQTPWLDQIAPEGVPVPLTPEQARNAATVLNVAPPPSATVLPAQATEYGVELVASVPPAPANAFSDLESSHSSVAELPPRKRGREPFDDDDSPRRRHRKKQTSMVLPLAIGGGLLALLIAAVAVVAFMGGENKPDESVQNKNEDEKSKEKPRPPEKEQPKPPDVPVQPKKDPIVPPQKDPVEPQSFNFDPDGVPELTMRWRGLTTGVSAGARFSANSDFVVAKDGGDTKSVRVFSSNNGNKLAGFTEGETALVDFAVLSDNNICSWHTDQPFAIVWSPATGKAHSKIPVRTPPFAPGPKLFDASPDGKYVVVGHAAPPGPKRDEPGQVFMLEAESGKEVLNAKALAPKFRWTQSQFVKVDVDEIQHYRLPSGTAGRHGDLGSTNRGFKVLGVSADAGLALHPGAGLPNIIDMKAGKVLTSFPQRFSPMHGAISDDGRLVALCTPSNKQNGELISHVEVMDLKARKLIGRYPLGPGALDVSSIAIAPDNTAMAITRSGRRVDCIELPRLGAVAVVPKKDPEPPTPMDPPQGAVGDASVKWTKELTGRGANFWFTPDGRHLFVHHSADSNIETYETETGVPGAVYKGKRYQEFGSIVKLDDGRVFTEVRSGQASLNNPVFLWDFKTGEELGSAIKPEWLPPEKEKSWISNVMSPNGRFVFSARNGPGKLGEIGKPYEEEEAPYRLTDTAGGKNVNILSSSWRGGSAKFTRDSKWFVMYDSRGQFIRMKPEEGGAENSWNAPVTSPMVKSILAVNADASLLLFQGVLKDSAFGTHVVDARTGKALFTLPKQSRGDWSGLSEDGKLAGAVEIRYGDKLVRFSVQLFDVQTGKLLSRVNFDQDINLVTSVKFTPDMKGFVISEGPKRRFSIYEFKNGGEAAVVPKKDPPAAGKRGDGWQERWAKDVPIRTSVFWFTGDGQHALLASFGNAPKLESFDLKTGDLVANYTGGVLEGPALQFVSKQDFGQVFAVTYSGNPLYWSFNTGKLIENFIKPEMLPKGDGAPAWLLSPDNKRLFAARLGKNKAAPGQPAELEPTPYQLLDMNTGAVLFGGNWSGGSSQFSSDSKWLMLYDAAGVFHRVNAATGAIDSTFQTPRNSPRGSSIQALTSDGSLMVFSGMMRGLPSATRLVETATGRVVATLPRDPFAGRAVISADGKFVGMPVSRGNQAFSAIVVEVATGKIVREAKFNFDPNYSATLHFTPDLKSFGFTEDKRAVMYDFIDDLVAVAPKKDPDPMPAPKKDPPKPAERIATPEEGAIVKAETKLRGLLKDDYARKSPAERKMLVIKLLGLADDTTDDPAFRYVMLRDARDIAVEVFEAPLAVQALDGIIRLYIVDGDALRIATFEKIRDTAGNTTTMRAVTEMAMAASDLALASDNHDVASRYAQIASTSAKRGNLPAPVVEEADGQVVKCQKSAEAFKPVAEALAKLMKNGNDEEACTFVGRHRCFVQGRWSEGLPLLAKGSSGEIKTAAALDAAAPKTPPTDSKIADAWWQAAETSFDIEKLGARHRARHWYAWALPSLQGEARTMAENRLGFNSGGTEYRTGLIAEFTAKVPSILQGKKARVDAGVDFNAGEFKADGAGIATDLNVRWTGAIVPQRAGRHRFAVNATDPVIIRIDGKVVLDTSAKGSRREALVMLPERPVPIVVEFKCINTDKHSVKLLWSTPGSELEEPIPPEALTHDKKQETALPKAP